MIALPRIEAIPRPVCRVGNGLSDDDAGLDCYGGLQESVGSCRDSHPGKG